MTLFDPTEVAAPTAPSGPVERVRLVIAYDGSAYHGFAVNEGVTTVVAPLTAPQGDGWDLIVSEMATPVRPDAWLAALRDGGRLAVVERSGAVGKAVLYVKGQGDALSRKVLFDSTPPILAELTPEPTFAL